MKKQHLAIAGIGLVGCVGVLALIAGINILIGWLAFLIYREFRPESWPYIGLWWMVLICLVVSAVIGGGRSK